MKTRAPAVLLGSVLLAACSGGPSAAGQEHGEALAPCPGSPNCVSTQAADEAHRIEALEYKDLAGAAVEAVRAATMEALVRVVEQTRRVHFRSASRIGYSDLGVNRKRMERIRELYRTVR